MQQIDRPRRLAAEFIGTAGLLATVVGSGIMGESLAARVVEHCFEELKACRYDQIRRRLGVSVDELRGAINEISRLDPRPRIDPVASDPGYITPDLVIEGIEK